MAVRITCINKSAGYHEDRHHAIMRLGWVNEQTRETGNSTREDMWTFVHNGGQAFVKDERGNIAYLTARTSAHGTVFVQTVADGKLTDNLLALVECA